MNEQTRKPWRVTRPSILSEIKADDDIQGGDYLIQAAVDVPDDKGWHFGAIQIRKEEGAALAPLIAAAPELLEACKAIIRWLGESHEGPSLDLARAAIAKAEGRDKCQSPDK